MVLLLRPASLTGRICRTWTAGGGGGGGAGVGGAGEWFGGCGKEKNMKIRMCDGIRECAAAWTGTGPVRVQQQP